MKCPICSARPAVERGNGTENLCQPCFDLWVADGEPEQARPALVKYRVHYRYKQTSGAGPFKGNLIVDKPYKRGDSISAPFGSAVVTKCGLMTGAGPPVPIKELLYRDLNTLRHARASLQIERHVAVVGLDAAIKDHVEEIDHLSQPRRRARA